MSASFIDYTYKKNILTGEYVINEPHAQTACNECFQLLRDTKKADLTVQVAGKISVEKIILAAHGTWLNATNVGNNRMRIWINEKPV